MRELKIGTSWVRGVVGEALNPEIIVNFSCAFGTWASGGPVVIGRDTRRSSPMIRSAVISGLLSTGCEVIDLGISPTPLIAFAVRELGAAGGLAITGSHNDASWNALKFIGPDGTLLNPVKSEELLDIYHASAFHSKPPARADGITEAPRILDRYLEHLLAALDIAGIRSRGFRVAIDFCNGSCHPILSRFLAELGCTLLPVNEQPSSQFAHPPTPSIANMRELAGLMGYLKADLGAAINIDGDRIAFATSDGTALSEEYTLPFAAQSRLARRPGPIVTNLSTSRMIDALASRHGQMVMRTLVGEGYVIDLGLEEGACIAGEGSGGVGALPITTSFDAALTLGLVLESLASADTTLTALAEGLPRYFMRKGELPCSADQVYRVLEQFRASYENRVADVTDGVRIEWSDCWAHVRASNTEPLLRVIVEAESEDRAGSLYDDAMSRCRRVLHRRKEM